ncbi:MAG TPA: cupin domain-containing protein [Pseudomonas sp.]|uniref:cupin domain-containing protein n=1 Tax=Pseudomonas sp. TaxID=306 RepID=UPI002B45D13B|nr:cupin domain-containing protein [Pseudomonas sp.]HKS12054.1 cupin domain-containing protein [Pseudomonas sp.]
MNTQLLHFEDDGRTPNSALPVVLHHRVLTDVSDAASTFEALFARHHWRPLWRAGIFDYHHYHSTAHEALGVASGSARVTLGGESGQVLELVAGDVLVLPAGTGHRCEQASDDFLVVGAYPAGREDYDLQRPGTADHAACKARILQVPMPQADPAFGADGALVRAWRPLHDQAR